MSRAEHYQKGWWAEWKAMALLWCKGYHRRAWRYKTKHGEIDLIVNRGKTLVFVEVKARDTYLDGVEAVSPKSRARIQEAAAHFVARHPRFAHYVWRFDVVVVLPGRMPYHIVDAWRP